MSVTKPPTSNSPSASRRPAAIERSSPRERSRVETRARLLASGQALFAERGLHGVTTHDIARKAGVAAGTFYLHFNDKAVLFREIVDSAVDELLERIHAACAPATSLGEIVERQTEMMVAFAEENQEVIRLLFSGDGDAARVGSDVLDRLASAIAEGRRELVAAGTAPSELEPAIVGQVIVGMWARVLAWWSEDPTRASRVQLIETLSRVQRSGTHPG